MDSVSKLGVISDVHGDKVALNQSLKHLKRLGCNKIVCCGDLVDYGVYPDDVVDILVKNRIDTVRGNHDRWAIGSNKFSDKVISYILKLPKNLRYEIDGKTILVCHGTPTSDMDCIFERNVDQEFVDDMLVASRADVILVGHTHIPMVLYSVHGCILNPGPLLINPERPEYNQAYIFDKILETFIPYEKPVGGTFGVLDTKSLEFGIWGIDGGLKSKSKRAS